MQDHIKIKRGLDLRIKGDHGNIPVNGIVIPDDYALIPADFRFIIPKPSIKEGDPVKAGTPVFYSKDNPEIKFASPVSGILREIRRGERRVIEAFIIESDNKSETVNLTNSASENSYYEELKNTFTESCLWPFIIQRPYGIIANPAQRPRDIFISGFDSAPLAPDLEILMKENLSYLQASVSALKKFTDGKIYIGIHYKYKGHSVFEKIKDAEIRYFSGPHPAGNVGIQIHHIAPINKGDVVWTISPEGLVVIGKVLTEKRYDISRTIAVAGSSLKNTGLMKSVPGMNLKCITTDNTVSKDFRVITGNVLTGRNSGTDGYFGFYDRMVTIIPEGKEHEFMGWAAPGFSKFSNSRAYFSWLMPKRKYEINTNYHGGERALVMTGEYEKVVPMDIYPQYLVKAIIAGDVEKMEKLGIYEVTEEDLALCDFVCTSKTEVQTLVSKGIEMMLKEMS